MGAIHAAFDISLRGAAAASLMPPLTAAALLRSRLKLRHVQLMVAIDAQRSIHKAASELRMTPPAATRLLSDLESLLGLTLFERTTRGIIATPHGASLIRHARAILGTLAHAGAELEAISAAATGKLIIGVLLVVAPVLRHARCCSSSGALRGSASKCAKARWEVCCRCCCTANSIWWSAA